MTGCGWVDDNGHKFLITEYAPNGARELLGGTAVHNAWRTECVCHLSLAIINLETTDVKEKGLDGGFTFISKVLT